MPLGGGVKFTSRVEATYVIRYDRDTAAGVQKFAGTLGPYDLSSGNGTPRIRGNWQNTLELDDFSLSATAYYVGRIKEVATDQGSLVDRLLGQPVQGRGVGARLHRVLLRQQLHQRRCERVVQGQRQVHLLRQRAATSSNARAPVAPAAYASAPNFLTTWHYAGLVGRKFSAGANFKF